MQLSKAWSEIPEIVSSSKKPPWRCSDPVARRGCFCCSELSSLTWCILCCGVSGFDCRCGNLFCGLHRYSDKHNCPYDYKAEAANKIRKENPVVVADKIQRIWRGHVWLYLLGTMGFFKRKKRKEKTLAQDLHGKGPVFFLLFVTLKGFSPQCMAVHICFQLFMLVGVWV